MSNIEEDVKLIKNDYIFTTHHELDDTNKAFRQSIINVLEDRERLIKENEELRYRIAKDYKRNGEYVKAKSIIINHKTEFISKDKIREIIRERQFELQQEYKDFKDDFILNELQDLEEDK